MNSTSDSHEPQDLDDLIGLVIVVAGAGGAAGPPLVERLAAGGATAVAAGSSRDRIEGVVADTTSGNQFGRVHAAAMGAARPQATFAGYTPVEELAEDVHNLWLTPATELNGRRL